MQYGAAALVKQAEQRPFPEQFILINGFPKASCCCLQWICCNIYNKLGLVKRVLIYFSRLLALHKPGARIAVWSTTGECFVRLFGTRVVLPAFCCLVFFFSLPLQVPSWTFS